MTNPIPAPKPPPPNPTTEPGDVVQIVRSSGGTTTITVPTKP